MRRWTRLVASIVLSAMYAAGGTPAHAYCDGDGSVPGTSASVTTVSAGPATFYVDDRDFADLDGNDESGGLWIYEESNGESGLQRGGHHWWLDATPSACDVDPIPVLAPDPNRPVAPNGITLFPDGFGGGPGGCWYWMGDPCSTYSVTPDRLWF